MRSRLINWIILAVVTFSVYPKFSYAPAVIRINLTADNPPEEVLVAVEGDNYYSSSTFFMRTKQTKLEFKSLPPGEYVVTVTCHHGAAHQGFEVLD